MISKKSFIKVSTLAVAVSLFALPLTAMAAAHSSAPTTTTLITNSPPVLGTVSESWVQSYVGGGSSDNRAESSTSLPTNAGRVITFTGTADDPNAADPYHLAICKTAIAQPTAAGSPTCNGGSWGSIGSEAADNAETTVTYTTQTGDVESNAWFAYACDKVAGSYTTGTALFTQTSGSVAGTGTAWSSNMVGRKIKTTGGDFYSITGFTNATTITISPVFAETTTSSTTYEMSNAACSLVNQGSGDSGTPFLVNHAPTFGTMTFSDSTDTSIAPGETIKFLQPNAQIDDADTVSSQDTVNLYVCSGEVGQGGVTTAFNYKTGACTGGTLLCSHTGVNPTSANATCNDGSTITSIPTAWRADYTVRIFMKDNHDFESSSGTQDQDFAVIDVAPTLTSYDTTDSTITLAAGVADSGSTYIATLVDDNGDMDVTLVEGYLFDDDALNLSSGACTPDENTCYKDTLCDLTTVSSAGVGPKLSLGQDKDLIATCASTAQWNANPGSNWEVHVNVTDSGAVGLVTNLAESSVNYTVNSIVAINVTQSTIAYGTVSLGTLSAVQTITLQNYGNNILDVLLHGTDMAGTPSGTIVAAKQKWHNTSDGTFWASSGNVMKNSSTGAVLKVDGCADRAMAIRNEVAVTTEDESMYWQIEIPSTQIAGSYTGTNTFVAAINSTCADGQ